MKPAPMTPAPMKPARMKPTPIGAVRPEVLEFPADTNLRPEARIHLDWNESRWPIPPEVTRAMAEAAGAADPRPYPDTLYPGLRRQLAEISDWDPDGIVFGSGGDDLLALAALATTGAEAAGIYPSPGFSMYPWALRLAGARALPYPLDDDLRYDLPAVRALLAAGRPSLAFVTAPHNPTGELLPEAALRELAAAAPGFLLVDEAYFEFSSGNARPLLDDFGNVLILRTFSKAMAMAGARLGYLLARPEAASLLRRAQAPFPVGVYTCRAAAAALGFREVLLDLTRRIAAERDSLAGRLRALPGVSVRPSEANFLLFHTPLPARVLSRRLLARGVSVRDFSGHPRLRFALRVTVGAPEENAVFLAALEESLAAAPAEEEMAETGASFFPVA